MAEASHVSCHISYRIYHTLVLYHSVSQFELTLIVSGRINCSYVLLMDGANGEKVVPLSLMLIPNAKVAILQLNFVVTQLDFLA